MIYTFQIQNDLQQRTKELLSSKAEFDDLKERSRVKLEEEIAKAQKLESALNATEDRLNGKEGQTSDLTKEMSIIKEKCNDQTKTIEGLKGELSEKTNSLEEALRHNKHKYVIQDNRISILIYKQYQPLFIDYA